MPGRNLTVPDAPTPHPARDAALVRDWFQRYTMPRRMLLLAGFACTAVLLVDPLRYLIREHVGRWFHVFLVAGTISISLAPLAEFLALRIGAVDWPDRRRVHHRPTPRLGGIAVFAAIVTSLSVNGIPDPSITLLLLCGGALFAIGCADDIIGVSAKVRLLAQVLLALILVLGGVILEVFPILTWWGQIGNGLLTILWIVGLTNAFNFFDGMDGLASGLAMLIAGFLGAIAFLTGQAHLGWVSVAILAATLGFMPYNFRRKEPARLFLGDGGSTVLGFLLAGLAIHGEWAVGHPLLNLSAPLLIFGVLIYDMIHTTVNRIARGDVRNFREWIEYAGKDHLHHRFEALLRSKRYAVMLIFLLTVCFGLSALVIRHVSLDVAFLLLLQCFAILVLVTILERAGNLRERRDVSKGERE
jgi:UDP-GlcNAc:undecaprenyl-phosphate GlcNAc-1-phosphate transferase